MNKKRAVYLANFIVAASAGLSFLTHEVWFVILIIPAAIYSYKNKPLTEREQDKLEDFRYKTFAGSILIPIGLLTFILILVVAFVIIMRLRG